MLPPRRQPLTNASPLGGPTRRRQPGRRHGNLGQRLQHARRHRRSPVGGRAPQHNARPARCTASHLAAAPGRTARSIRRSSGISLRDLVCLPGRQRLDQGEPPRIPSSWAIHGRTGPFWIRRVRRCPAMGNSPLKLVAIIERVGVASRGRRCAAGGRPVGTRDGTRQWGHCDDAGPAGQFRRTLRDVRWFSACFASASWESRTLSPETWSDFLAAVRAGHLTR